MKIVIEHYEGSSCTDLSCCFECTFYCMGRFHQAAKLTSLDERSKIGVCCTPLMTEFVEDYRGVLEPSKEKSFSSSHSICSSQTGSL